MRILVTRPLPDAEETAQRLRVLGHEPVVAPLLAIVTAAPPAGVPAPAAIVMTSRNAVRALSGWPQAGSWLTLPVFVTGRATASAARRVGFKNVRSGEGDAGALASLVMAQIGSDVRPILYPAARDRSEALVNRLQTNGYEVCTLEAYAAEMVDDLDPAVRQAIASSSIDAILFYSRRTAAAFRRIVDRAGIADGLQRTALLVLSERVAEPLRDLGTEIRVAARPDEDSLFALLSQAGG